MCIICYKRAGVTAPSTGCIKSMFENNPDGAGILIKRKRAKKYNIYKGFMTIEDYLCKIDALKIKPQDEVVYHFRIATSGGVQPGLTHPFPVSDRVKDLFSEEISCSRAFIHNGVFGNGEGKLSDTQKYIRDNLANVESIKENLEVIATQTQGSRCIVMDISEGTFLTGKWVFEFNLFFSNSTYEKSYRSYLGEDYFYKGGYKNYNYMKTTTAAKGCLYRYTEEQKDRLCEYCTNMNCTTKKDKWESKELDVFARPYVHDTEECGYGFSEDEKRRYCIKCTQGWCYAASPFTGGAETTQVSDEEAELLATFRTKKFDCAHPGEQDECIACEHYWECVACYDADLDIQKGKGK